MDQLVKQLDSVGVKLEQYGIDASTYDGDSPEQLLEALLHVAPEGHVDHERLLALLEEQRRRFAVEHGDVFVPKPHPLPLLVASVVVGTGAAVLSYVGLCMPLPTLFVPPVAGVVLVGVGLFTHYRARQAMREHKTSPEFSKGVRALVTNGVYRYTRNPMYLAGMLVGTGVAIASHSLYPLFAIALWGWYVNSKVIPGEEALCKSFHSTD